MMRVELTRTQIRIVKEYLAVLRDLPAEETDYLDLDEVKVGFAVVKASDDFWSLMVMNLKDDARAEGLNEATRKSMVDAVRRISEAK